MDHGVEQVRKTWLGKGRVRYDWIRWESTGAIQAWAEFVPNMVGRSCCGSLWIGGIECHAASGEGDPSHEQCWVLGKSCWHDGSSLQFSEEIEQFLPDSPDLTDSHHAMVLSVVRSRIGWLPADLNAPRDKAMAGL